jgi:hypothetical protein
MKYLFYLEETPLIVLFMISFLLCHKKGNAAPQLMKMKLLLRVASLSFLTRKIVYFFRCNK